MQSVLFWVTDAQPDKDSQFVTHWLPLSHGPRSTTGTREEEASRYQKRGSQKGLGNSTGEAARRLYRVCAGPRASASAADDGWGGGSKVESVLGEQNLSARLG